MQCYTRILSVCKIHSTHLNYKSSALLQCLHWRKKGRHWLIVSFFTIGNRPQRQNYNQKFSQNTTFIKINWIFVKFVFHIFSLWSLFLFQILFVYMCLILYVVNHLSFSFILFLWRKLKSCLSITQLFWVLTNGLLRHIRVTFCHNFIEKDIFGTMFWGSWSKKDIIKV